MQDGNSVRVLVKVGALLDRLSEEPEVSAAVLAETIGEPRSTVNRLLATLQRLGMVEPGVDRGRYRIGLKLFRLGSTVLARFDERQAALPVMERIHEQTGETVFLCIRRDWEAVCIERLDGRRVQSLALRLGGALPLHLGAAPRVLLAFEPEAFWARYAVEAPLDPMTGKSIVSSEQLYKSLRRIRKLGYSVSDEDVTVGIAAIGAPIFDYTETIKAALSISGVRPAILGDQGDDLRELLVDAAREISSLLGLEAFARVNRGG